MISNHNEAPFLGFVSICSTILSWISFYEAQFFVSFIASGIAVLTGVFALRYYWYAGSVKKEQLKQNKDGNTK